MHELAGKVALVTGASRGIGRAVAVRLASEGASIYLAADGTEAELEAAQAACRAAGAAAAAWGLHDLALDGAAEARVAAAHQRMRRIDILVNNAGLRVRKPFGDFTHEEFDRLVAVNLRAPVLLTEAFADLHRAGEDGLVVNLLDSKLAAPNPDFLSYTLSKQALAGFTELAARALAPKGIRVNGIAPSLMLRSPGQTDENFERVHSRNPLGRGVDPADVAAAIRYLASARTVTGEVIVIDGGQRFLPPPRDVQFL